MAKTTRTGTAAVRIVPRAVSVAVAAVLVLVLGVAASSSAAPARSTYCSRSGDVCYGAFGSGTTIHLRLSLFARYFTRYRLCVDAPNGHGECRRFVLRRAAGGSYRSEVRWAARFPFAGPGVYHARWFSPSGVLGPRVDFVEGPSIHVRPKSVRAGGLVRVFGLAGGCPAGDAVTLMSRAFPAAREFGGIPAVHAAVDRHDRYGVSVRIPDGRRAARYVIAARCGGGNFGVQATLAVRPGKG